MQPARAAELRAGAVREQRRAKGQRPEAQRGDGPEQKLRAEKQRSLSTGVTDTQQGDEFAELFLGPNCTAFR